MEREIQGVLQNVRARSLNGFMLMFAVLTLGRRMIQFEAR